MSWDDDRDDRWEDDGEERRRGRGPRDREDAQEAVIEQRREVEERLAELKASIGRELGVVPAAKYTLLALVAGATGLALALKRRKKRKNRSTR